MAAIVVLGFPIGTILAIFALQVTPKFPSKFRVNWSFASEEEAQNSFFSTGDNPIHRSGTILAILVESHLGNIHVKFD